MSKTAAPLAALANAVADYESAYRAEHGRDPSPKNEANAAAMAAAYLAGTQARAKLSEAIGPDLAKEIAVALIFAASRTEHERHDPTYASASDTERALKRPWEYV